MRQSDAVKVARMQLQAKQLEAVVTVITNPIVLYVAGFYAVEKIQQSTKMEGAVATMLRAGILAAPLVVKAMDTGTAKTGLEQVGGLAKESISLVGKSLPLLAGGL
jgi:hypothetical protein